MKATFLASLPFLAALLPLRGALPGQDDDPPAGAALTQAFASQGIHLDLDAGVCAVPVSVEVRDDLLEYLLVLPQGASHESLFVAAGDKAPAEQRAWVETLNAALLAMGLEAGSNARWIEKDPAPTERELRAGTSPYDVLPPAGDGLHLYAAWHEEGDLHFHPVEDLVRDLERGRTLRRHPFVYLGSRMVERRSGEVVFAASLEGNLINISFFSQGNTLLTAALPECVSQKSWLPNAWLLPERGSPVLLLLSHERLRRPPASLAPLVPTVLGGTPVLDAATGR